MIAVSKLIFLCFSGSVFRHNTVTLVNSYQLDLSAVRLGSRVAIMRCANGNLHYYLDGVDQGVACSNVPSGIQIFDKAICTL